jgi:adenylate kinase family enzyme
MLQHRDAEGFVIDGWPRNLPQVIMHHQEISGYAMQRDPNVRDFYRALYESSHLVLEVNTSSETAKYRIKARRVCSGCKTTYNVIFRPSADGVTCDRPDCRQPLIQREDDASDEGIDARSKEYDDLAMPMINYCKVQGIYEQISGEEEPNLVYLQAVQVIERRWGITLPSY